MKNNGRANVFVHCFFSLFKIASLKALKTAPHAHWGTCLRQVSFVVLGVTKFARVRWASVGRIKGKHARTIIRSTTTVKASLASLIHRTRI